MLADDRFAPVVHWAALIQGDCSEPARAQADCWVAADLVPVGSAARMADGHFAPAGHSAQADCWVLADMVPVGSAARMADGHFAQVGHSAQADCSVLEDLVPVGSAARMVVGRFVPAGHSAPDDCWAPAGSAAAGCQVG